MNEGKKEIPVQRANKEGNERKKKQAGKRQTLYWVCNIYMEITCRPLCEANNARLQIGPFVPFHAAARIS
jgi:hypothetical protein